MDSILDYVRLYFNDITVKSTNHKVPLFPGLPNTVRISSSRAKQSNLHLRFELISPSGDVYELANTLLEPSLTIAIGPLASPSVYQHENGVTFRRGYRLAFYLTDASPGKHVVVTKLYQGLTRDKEEEWFFFGDKERVLYNDGYIPEDEVEHIFSPFYYSGRPMCPPYEFRMSPKVLMEQDRVELCFRLRRGTRREESSLPPCDAEIIAMADDGSTQNEPYRVRIEAGWGRVAVDVSSWPAGRYRFRLHPICGGQRHEDGPTLHYHRQSTDDASVPVSPFAPFAMTRDLEREMIRIDWRTLALDDGWQVTEDGLGELLLCQEGADTPLEIDPDVKGWYAVFAEALFGSYKVDGPYWWPAAGTRKIHLQVGQGVIREMTDCRLRDFATADQPSDELRLPLFMDVQELTGETLKIFAHRAGAGMRRIRLVPVTESSVRDFQNQTRELPYEIRGFDDWQCHFREESRLEIDQFDFMLEAQRELGVNSVAWAIGRSTLEYSTKLPNATKYPASGPNPANWGDLDEVGKVWAKLINEVEPCPHVMANRQRYDMKVYPWLTMNLHTEMRGAEARSVWMDTHPEFHQYLKGSKIRDPRRVEYYFQECQEERLDILMEVAEWQPDGLVLDCCRQPPMAGYNPTMVADYKRLTGLDANQLDRSSGDDYVHWLKWRSEGLTNLLRKLRSRLEERLGADVSRIPVAVRVPCEGFFMNLALGMNVEAWIAERLVDELQLDPLNHNSPAGSQDITPYIEPCRRQNIKLFAGMSGSSTMRHYRGVYNPLAGLKRAMNILQDGVAGLEIYCCEQTALMHHERWLYPLFGNPERARQFLASSNLEAVLPIQATNAMLGHDNHWWDCITPDGTTTLPRGASRFA